MTLQRFFAEMGPFLTGHQTLAQLKEALGPLPSCDADYHFYAALLLSDQGRILAEMYPAVRVWLEQQHIDWGELCHAFALERPPKGYSVPHVGEGFADWLVAHRSVEARLPVGVEAVADLIWTRFVARTAPDAPGLGLDRRLFVRHYPIDPVAASRALLERVPLPDPHPVTILIYRCVRRSTVHEISASRATIAVLLKASGALVPPALHLTDVEAEVERSRLEQKGVLCVSGADLSSENVFDSTSIQGESHDPQPV